MNFEKIITQIRGGKYFTMIKNDNITTLAVLTNAKTMKVEYVKANEVLIAEGYTVQDLINDVVNLKNLKIQDKFDTINKKAAMLGKEIELVDKKVDLLKKSYDIEKVEA